MTQRSKKFIFLSAKHDGGDWRLTSIFGKRSDPITGIKGSNHNGIDIGCYLGTKIYSPADGKITAMTHLTGGGNTLQITTDEGVEYTFMHLHDYSPNIAINKLVKKNDHIGFTGNSGARTTGAHLHIEVKINGKQVDPWEHLENKQLVYQ